MANLLGTLRNSAGEAIDGRLDVRLSRGLIDDTTTPDSWNLPVTKSFVITSGVVNITLIESETSQIPYVFEFFQKIGETGSPATPIYSDTSLFSFNAIVPNVGTVQFTSLTPTGISNANLDTGAFTIARYLANDPNLIVLVRSDIVSSVEFDGITISTKKFIPKPFAEGLFVKSLYVISPSGYNNWTFRVGYTDATGVDQLVTGGTTTQNTVIAGRKYITTTYNAALPNVINGVYIEAVAGSGATALDAFASVSYQRTV
jgi:hypothetical protein